MSYQHQKAELVEEHEVWLRAIYKNPSASEKELSIKLYKQLGHDFDPQEMPHILFSAPQVPSLLALTYIDPKSPMIKLANQSFKYIKEKLQDNPSLERVTSEDLTRRLNCFESAAQATLGHIASLPNTYSSARGMSGDKFGYYEIGFGDDVRQISSYFKHDSIHSLIEESYLNSMKQNESSDTGRSSPQITISTQLPTEKIVYIDPGRIDEIKVIHSEEFDLSKLIRLCEEINATYSSESFYSVVMLLRAILDHVPPIFGKDNFSQVASEIKGNTNQRVFKRLDQSLKDQANIHLHHQIRKKESPANKTQIDFRAELDTLLVEIIHELH